MLLDSCLVASIQNESLLEAVSAAVDNLNQRNKGPVKSITAHFGDSKESFECALITPSSEEKDECERVSVKLKTDTLGHTLTSLMNIDFDNVAAIFVDLKWEIDADARFDPPVNFAEIYSRLLSVSDVFGLYLPSEWSECREDLEYATVGVAVTMDKLRKYISFCEQRSLKYNSPFFTFLISTGFFGVLGDDIFVQGKQWELFERLYVGDAGLELTEWYDVFEKNIKPAIDGVHSYTIEPSNSIASKLERVAMISLKELSDRGKVIRKCQICGRHFVPANRSDTLYCDNPSPENPKKTCKEYGRTELCYKKQKEDEIAHLARNIASAKSMLAKRNPDIPEYERSYRSFIEQRDNWKNAVENGEKTNDDFKEWLLEMKKRKIL